MLYSIHLRKTKPASELVGPLTKINAPPTFCQESIFVEDGHGVQHEQRGRVQVSKRQAHRSTPLSDYSFVRSISFLVETVKTGLLVKTQLIGELPCFLGRHGELPCCLGRHGELC